MQYDSSSAEDVRLLDGPGATTPLITELTALLAANASKLPVVDSAAETSLATLAGTVSAGKVQVSGASGSSGPASSIAVAAAAAAAAVVAGAHTLYAIVVSAVGTAAVTITDGPGGKVIAVIPANQPIGDVPLYGVARPFATSIYANTGAGSPAFTILYT